MIELSFDDFCNKYERCSECRYEKTNSTEECKFRFNEDITREVIVKKLDKILSLLENITNK